LLTLIIIGVVIVHVVKGDDLPVLWNETLMIALAHYFTSRRFIRLPPDELRRLEAEGKIETEAHPLYLPRHSIRVIIIAAFVGLAAYLYREGKLFEPSALSIVGVVFAYLLGNIARGLVNLWKGGRQTTVFRTWEDIKAVVVLLLLGGVAVVYFLGLSEHLPRQVDSVTLALVLFYFGSR
jgi:hypothetical protein